MKVQIPVFAPLPEAQRTTRTPLVGARKLIAEHMVKSVQTSPHVTTFEDIDLTELVKFRNADQEGFPRDVRRESDVHAVHREGVLVSR